MSQGVTVGSSSLRALSRAALIAVVGIWIAVAAPMLTLGPGSDVDAWTVARTGERIWESGTYVRSRTSGFPLYEIALAPLVHAGGTVATNLLSLVAALACLLLIVHLARRGKLRRPLLTLVLFAFLPVFIKNATSTMDYVPALALLLLAYAAWDERRWWWCAIWIGVACGVRPTSALFIVPAAAATWLATRRAQTAAAMVAVAAAVGTAAFWPSLRLGGFGPVRSVTALQGVRTGLELFGVLQTPVLIVLLAWSLRALKRWTPFDVFHVTTIAVFGAAFWLHPGGAEYLLPIVPAVVLLLDRYASRDVAIAAAVVALSYHVVAIDVEGTRGGTRPVTVSWTAGYTVRDVDDRRFKLWLKERTARWPGVRPTVLLELQMQPFASDPSWTYDSDLNVFRGPSSAMAVAQLIQDPAALERIHAAGFRVVARREREWLYLRPESAAAHDYVEFIDLGALMESPPRGSPLE